MLWPARLPSWAWGLATFSLCCWCSSASRSCCFHSCARSLAGSRQPSARATRLFSLSHVTTWMHREDQALLPGALPSPSLWAVPRKGGLSLGQLLPSLPLGIKPPPPQLVEPRRNPAGNSAAAGAPPVGGGGSGLAPGVPLSCQKEGLMCPQACPPGPGAAQGCVHAMCRLPCQPRAALLGSHITWIWGFL